MPNHRWHENIKRKENSNKHSSMLIQLDYENLLNIRKILNSPDRSSKDNVSCMHCPALHLNSCSLKRFPEFNLFHCVQNWKLKRLTIHYSSVLFYQNKRKLTNSLSIVTWTNWKRKKLNCVHLFRKTEFY